MLLLKDILFFKLPTSRSGNLIHAKSFTSRLGLPFLDLMLKQLLAPAKTFSRLLRPSFAFSMSSVPTTPKTNIVYRPFLFHVGNSSNRTGIDGGKEFKPDYDMEKFEKKINDIYEKNGGEAPSFRSIDGLYGYAPFCKHIFIENFVGT